MNKNQKIVYCIVSIILIFGIAIIAWAYENKKFGIFASGEVKAISIENQAQWENSGSLENLNFDPKGMIIKGLSIDSQYKVIPIIETTQAQNQNNQSGIKLAKSSDMIPMLQKSSGGCSGYLPDNWEMHGFDESRTGVSINLGPNSNDNSMSASYMITSVVKISPGTPGAGNYDASTPESFIGTMLTGGGIGGFKYTSGPHDMSDGYKLAFWGGNFQGNNVKGFALYKTFPIDDANYIISLRTGAARENLWEANKATIYDSVSSVRCTKNLQPVAGVDVAAEKQQGTSGRDIAAVAEKDREAIMGYENAYSPSTGERYQIPSSLYNPTGPEGAGYYRSTGTNSYEKLNMGFGY